ncbi:MULTISPECIES: AMP-binding protein [Marinobacter]|jgi:cyclohexanecarboxylate-CoA ligase|uniref:AMP-binding protein n=1 Tax=Marinobacter shengliensis TaxID=1389223 RepID=A0ABV4WA89_9GAMM|nr:MULTISPECIES: AMP-binding protein [unclassified Marinobacter]AKV98272.1 cyclohexanecarboxylate--CoA ligase [Marinobacter sp. CP1]MCP4063327.1 AMP-binding protein [Gammaproteobacteria bacterium]|tara:strand:- start:698 stop:2362 length:1665 start_codon:yes stop_codon:yes gene_type:complete
MDTGITLNPQRRAAMIESGAWTDKLITDYLDQAIASTPDREAIVGYQVTSDTRGALTYRELNDRVTRMATGLAAMGIDKGDLVACQLPNWWQTTALHLACIRIGAILNPLMPIFRERELRFMLKHGEAKLLVIPKIFRGFDYEAMIDGIRGELPNLETLLVIEGEGERSFEQRLMETPWEEKQDTKALFAERQLSADDAVQILYTSGTTGEPKGVVHTSNTLLSNVRAFSDRLHLTSNDKILMASPVAHQTGFTYGILVPIYLGTTSILQDIWDAEYVCNVIAAEKPAFTMAATPFLADLVKTAPKHEGELDSLRIFVSAGAPIPSAVVEQAGKVLNAKIVSAWGMTENGAVTTTCPEDPDERASQSDGKALTYTEVKVTDFQGNELPAGEEGSLLVRGSSLFVGYLKRPELYGVDEGGWFNTGDLARVDKDGYIRITGRTKDVVIRGGENIPVVEVENLLYKFPGIADVALVGCPDERLGERLCAYVTLDENATDLTLDELKSYLTKQQLSKSYLPEYLEVIEAMPRTASGKIQKFKLREQAKEVRLEPAKRA